MLGEWYLPPGECQVIWTITEGTISISHLAILTARAGLLRTPYPETLSTKDAQLVPRPRSGGLTLEQVLQSSRAFQAAGSFISELALAPGAGPVRPVRPTELDAWPARLRHLRPRHMPTSM